MKNKQLQAVLFCIVAFALGLCTVKFCMGSDGPIEARGQAAQRRAAELAKIKRSYWQSPPAVIRGHFPRVRPLKDQLLLATLEADLLEAKLKKMRLEIATLRQLIMEKENPPILICPLPLPK